MENYLTEDYLSLKTNGTFDFTFEYDFKGAIICNEDGTYSGSIDFFNMKMTFSCTENVYDGYDRGDDYVTYMKVGFDLYKNNEAWFDIGIPVSYTFTAAVSEDFVCRLATKAPTYCEVALMSIYSRIHVRHTYYDDYGIEHTSEGDNNVTFISYAIMVLNNKNLLLPFDLIDGTWSYSSNTFLDNYQQGYSEGLTFNLSMTIEGVTFSEESNVSCSTEMEITVVDHTAELND